MKRFLTMVAALALTSGAASAADNFIAGSAHDFSTKSWGDGQICKPCHTPHNAIAADVSGRLWNHTLSTAAYTLHGGRASGQGTTLDNKRAGTQADIDMYSRLCLSCHDGTVALDSFGGKTAPTGILIGADTASADLGTDLSNDHPIGVAAVYREEYAPSPGHYPYQPIAAAKAAGVRFVTVPGTRDYTNQAGTAVTGVANEAVSCTSCHNPHGSGVDDGSGSGTNSPNLLRVTNVGSQLCLTCHNK